MIDLDDLEKLEKAATPGPWTGVQCADGYGLVRVGEELHGNSLGYEIDGHDANLIIAMRNALPEMIKELRRCRRILQAAASGEESDK